MSGNRTRLAIVTALPIALFACGDDSGGTPDARRVIDAAATIDAPVGTTDAPVGSPDAAPSIDAAPTIDARPPIDAFMADAPPPADAALPIDADPNAGDGGVQRPVINELVVNHTGTDNCEYLEVYGGATTDYSGYSVIAVEGDVGANPGLIDDVFTIGTTDANGFWHTGLLMNELENSTTTFLLVQGFSGAMGNDLDTNDDGTFDTTPWTNIIDSVTFHDGGGSDVSYSTAVLMPNYDGLGLPVGGASRIPDAMDTDTSSDWVRNDFDANGLTCHGGGNINPGEAKNTPGATNEVQAP